MEEEHDPATPEDLDIAVVVVALERNRWGQMASEAHGRIIERGEQDTLRRAIHESDRRRALDARRTTTGPTGASSGGRP